MKSLRSLLTIMIIATIALSIVQMTVSNIFSTDGITLSKMENTIDELQRENIALKEKIYTLSALTTIEDKATQEGFVESKSQLVLGTTTSLAIKP